MRSPDDRSVKELTLAAAGFEDPGLFAVLEHAAETPERYDDLTFGLVAMQHDGTVFAYGAVEAKYSGISPARVLGRNFFTDVAAKLDEPASVRRDPPPLLIVYDEGDATEENRSEREELLQLLHLCPWRCSGSTLSATSC